MSKKMNVVELLSEHASVMGDTGVNGLYICSPTCTASLNGAGPLPKEAQATLMASVQLFFQKPLAFLLFWKTESLFRH